jgi:hypothetical protein
VLLLLRHQEVLHKSGFELERDHLPRDDHPDACGKSEYDTCRDDHADQRITVKLVSQDMLSG